MALPIWECKACGWFDVIGNEQELEAKAVEGWEAFAGHTPHRPYVDAVKIRCEGCGATVSRVSDVGNPWLDAGIVAYSTLQYRTDPAFWEGWFPADLITESFPGQFRNWFYALLAIGSIPNSEGLGLEDAVYDSALPRGVPLGIRDDGHGAERDDFTVGAAKGNLGGRRHEHLDAVVVLEAVDAGEPNAEVDEPLRRRLGQNDARDLVRPNRSNHVDDA